jgi:hypothetical protein
MPLLMKILVHVDSVRVFPAESDAFAIEGQQAMVGDSHSMGVAAQVSEHLARATHGGLGIDDPNPAGAVDVEAWQTASNRPTRRLVRRSGVACVGKGVSVREELAAEDPAQHFYRQKECSADSPSGGGPEKDLQPGSRNGYEDAATGSVPKCAEC